MPAARKNQEDDQKALRAATIKYLNDQLPRVRTLLDAFKAANPDWEYEAHAAEEADAYILVCLKLPRDACFKRRQNMKMKSFSQFRFSSEELDTAANGLQALAGFNQMLYLRRITPHTVRNELIYSLQMRDNT